MGEDIDRSRGSARQHRPGAKRRPSRFWVVLAALALMTGCRAKWKPCEYLEITARNTAGKPVWLRYENARYRVLDTDPLTIEWEHIRCIEIESQAGTVEEVCGRELQTGPVDRVACR